MLPASSKLSDPIGSNAGGSPLLALRTHPRGIYHHVRWPQNCEIDILPVLLIAPVLLALLFALPPCCLQCIHQRLVLHHVGADSRRCDFGRAPCVEGRRAVTATRAPWSPFIGIALLGRHGGPRHRRGGRALKPSRYRGRPCRALCNRRACPSAVLPQPSTAGTNRDGCICRRGCLARPRARRMRRTVTGHHDDVTWLQQVYNIHDATIRG